MRRRSVVLLATAALGMAACSGSGDGDGAVGTSATGAPIPSSASDPAASTSAPTRPLPLRIDLIEPAMAAVDAARGGPQEYFEINATGQLVNLFVAIDGGTRAVAYVYRPRGLDEPTGAEPSSGPTFSAADVVFEPTILDTVLADLPTSLPRLFALNATPDGAGVERRVYVTSSQGGRVEVLLGPDGAVLSTQVG